MTVIAPGKWRVVSYASGTITVADGKLQSTKFGVRGVGPHIGIHYRRAASDGSATLTTDHERYALAEKLAGLLNGSDQDRTGLVRKSEIVGASAGIEFSAIGPHVDRNPPNCFWFEDDRPEAKSSRAKLIDRVFGIE